VEIPGGGASMLVFRGVRRGALQEQLLTSQMLRNREDYEVRLMHLSQFFEFVKEQYAKPDPADRIPLDQLP
jgi:hypothetical protein